MAWNPFIGWTRTDLEAALTRAQTDLSQGKSTIQASDGNINIKSTVSNRPETRIRMILRALSLIAPTDYPPDQVNPITETRVTFGAADPNQ